MPSAVDCTCKIRRQLLDALGDRNPPGKHTTCGKPDVDNASDDGVRVLEPEGNQGWESLRSPPPYSRASPQFKIVEEQAQTYVQPRRYVGHGWRSSESMPSIHISRRILGCF